MAVEPGGELPYHERWEPRVFALHLLIGAEGLGAGPGGRPMREEMDPAHYLAASYYERWLWSAEQRLLRKGTIAPGDVERMMERVRGGEDAPAHRDEAMARRIREGLRIRHPLDPPPADARLAPGDRVRLKRMRPAGVTRSSSATSSPTASGRSRREATRFPSPGPGAAGP